ncbi:MAG: hypothetical protein ACFCUM_03265 [Bacteroidales bacterium]
MNIIKQNPFRILGLTGDASERELQRQLGKIKAFERVGKNITLDYDFEFIGDITRTADEIQDASNRIEQAHKKLLYSLFWFVKNSSFDEIAFNNLKEKEIEKAIEIWNKTLKGEITRKNYSSYHNLSTLYIALSTVDEQIEFQKLQIGISLKGNLIHSENLKDFSKLVTGNGIANDSIEISKKFADEVIELLKPHLNKKNGISTNDLISLFNTFPATIQKYISSKFTDVPISSIENKIEKTTRKRKDNPRDAEEYGEELYQSTRTDLTILKTLLNKNSVQFQSITNKLANEILQCSIDFFNEVNKEDLTDFDPLDDAFKVAKYAKSIGPTGQTENRVLEALNTLEEVRDRYIHEIIAFLNQIIDVFEHVEKENTSGRLTIINGDKIMEVARPLFDDLIIEKIAKSEKNKLIRDFFNSINKLITKVPSLYIYYFSDFFEKKKSTFISYLPISNSIKFKFVKEKLETEISNLQKKLSNTKNKKMYTAEMQLLERQLSRIKEWQMFRTQVTKERQIAEQQQKINSLILTREAKKKEEILIIEKQIDITKRELNNLTK